MAPNPVAQALPWALLVAWMPGCSWARGTKRLTHDEVVGAIAVSDAGGSRDSSPSATGGPGGRTRRSAAVFSAPIAAARVGVTRVVAGLVVADSVIRVIGWSDGQPPWMVDALRGVAWSPDAELRIEPMAGGVAVLWHGMMGGRVTGTLAVLGPRGESRGAPTPIGSGFCATLEGSAWIEPHAAGPIRVDARRGDEPAGREVASLSSDRAVTLVCGEHHVFVLGDGDDDLTSTSFVPGEGHVSRQVVVMRDTDFGDDDEREHYAFTSGDDLALVRVGSSGVIETRRIAPSGPSAWRKLDHRLSEDDDIVSVDGDARVTVIAFTSRAKKPCADGGSTAEIVRVLRIDRASGAESTVDVTPPDCEGAPGPVWIAWAPSDPMVAWARRGADVAPGAAPIGGLSFLVLGGEAHREGRRDVEADALVEGGCDGEGCFAAALEREPGQDASHPESIVTLAFP